MSFSLTKTTLISLVTACILSTSIYAQNTDKEIFTQIFSKNLPKQKSERFVFIAKQFLGKPYVSGSLESDEPEHLVTKLDGFDCSTLVESCLALANTQKPDFEEYKKALLQIRYREGKLNGYGSRLHYLSEWLVDNQKKNYINLESKNLSGQPYLFTLNFMSSHWQLYPSANTPEIKKEILASEKKMQQYKLYYLPKSNLKPALSKIQEGDIIAITTSKKGLDCSHQGIAVLQNGNLHLLHASSEKKKVIISNEDLLSYLNRVKSHSGIMVARLK